MTEKSEDQVAWICHECGYSWKENPANTPGKTHTRLKYFPDCEVEAKQVIYIEAYLALKSDLALAVEALKQLNKDCCCVLDHSWQKELTEEALGKIGEK